MISPAVMQRMAANLAAVRSRLDAAAARSGRAPESIRLVAVSKTFDADHVRAAHAAGQRHFGENKVQEALAKRAATAELDLEWHLIGHLQSNKVRKAVEAFDWVESVDRPDLLEKLDAAAADHGKSLQVLVQVDLAGEDTKHGVAPSDLRALLQVATGCTAVSVVGLMVLPPWSDEAERSRPWFRRLRELRDQLLDEGMPPAMLAELSMGMSHDFEVAVEEGATTVRVGTALFGQRAPVA